MKSRRGHSAQRVKPLELVLPDRPEPTPIEPREMAERKARMKRFDAALKRAMSRKPNASGFVCVLPEEAIGYEPPTDQTEEMNQAPEMPKPKPGPHNQ